MCEFNLQLLWTRWRPERSHSSLLWLPSLQTFVAGCWSDFAMMRRQLSLLWSRVVQCRIQKRQSHCRIRTTVPRKSMLGNFLVIYLMAGSMVLSVRMDGRSLTSAQICTTDGKKNAFDFIHINFLFCSTLSVLFEASNIKKKLKGNLFSRIFSCLA